MNLCGVEAFFLMNTGVDMEVTDNNGSTALDLAIKKGFTDIDRALKAANGYRA